MAKSGDQERVAWASRRGYGKEDQRLTGCANEKAPQISVSWPLVATHNVMHYASYCVALSSIYVSDRNQTWCNRAITATLFRILGFRSLAPHRKIEATTPTNSRAPFAFVVRHTPMHVMLCDPLFAFQ